MAKRIEKFMESLSNKVDEIAKEKDMSNKTELFDKNGNALSIADVMVMLPPVTFLEKVNRVEVIDQNGRSYVNWKPTNKVRLSIQDDGRTAKIFID